MNFSKVAIMLKKQLRDTVQMERHLRVRGSWFFRKMWFKKKLCGKSLSRNQIIKHIPVMMTLAQIRYNLTFGQLKVLLQKFAVWRKAEDLLLTSLLSSTAVVTMKQIEERGGERWDSAAIKQFSHSR